MKQNLFSNDIKDYFKKFKKYEIDGIIFYDKKDYENYIKSCKNNINTIYVSNY
jgi:hypothetical protein